MKDISEDLRNVSAYSVYKGLVKELNYKFNCTFKGDNI